MPHYHAHTRTDDHVLFTSRWGEVLLINRHTLVSYYNQSGENSEGASEAADFSNAYDAGTFDHVADNYLACGGEDVPLPPDVSEWLTRNPA